SSLALLLACAALGLLVAAGLAAAAPRLLAGHAPQVVDTAGWTILLLCGSAAVQLPAGVFNGVITGHERFDVLNGIRIARDLLGLGAMLALLLGGFGLVAL